VADRDRIRAVIRDEWGIAEFEQSTEAAVLADRIDREVLAPLRVEVRRALYLTPLGEVMGRGVLAAEVPLLVEWLREGDDGPSA
jgi:hypothetical protein